MEEEPKRPDPEALLEKVREERGEASKGKLKIFFGYAAGVGKTYAMLEAAHVAVKSLSDLVVGYIEPHTRPETVALSEGFETIPPFTVPYRGMQMMEFDLDAALKRRPSILLVDELAHSNVPGTRHAKRWQDVEELLTAGISVYTTLNVQHLESMNDVIAKITGVVVRETVPDLVFDEADQLELVDITPEGLLQRFREGKVYFPEQARHAAANFFQKPNLMALRELALRRVADTVKADVELARLRKSPQEIWATSERIMVSVSTSKTSAKLIRAASRLAGPLGAQVIAMHVETPSDDFKSERDTRQLLANFQLAEGIGAEVVTLNGDDAAKTLVDYARFRNVTRIVIGKGSRRRLIDRLKLGIVDRVIALSGDIEVQVIRGEEKSEKEPSPRPKSRWWKLTPKNGLVTLLVVAVTTVTALLARRVGLSETDIIMIYVLGIATAGALFGRGPDLVATALSILSFNFFFIEPHFTFAIANTRYLLTFVVLWFVGFVISSLTARIRKQTDIARERERRTEALFRLSRHLAESTGVKDLVDAAVEDLGRMLDSGVTILVADTKGRLRSHYSAVPPQLREPNELAVAEWVYNHGEMAGAGTGTLPLARGLYIPVQSSRGPLGVLAVYARDVGSLFVPEQKHLLETLTNQVGFALERDILSEEKQRVLLQIESERLRSSLFQSVSHDLRTPLAIINGTCSSLLEEGEQYDDGTRAKLLTVVLDETRWLTQLVDNLLNISRIESESAPIVKQWVPLEEVIGSSIGRIEKYWQPGKISARLPEDMCVVSIDPVLIEQVLVNLLDNAMKYAPEGSPVEIHVARDTHEVTVSVLDRGPGIMNGDKEVVFEKFYRTREARTSGRRGAGIGLAICKAIVQAHRGSIGVRDRDGGGSVFWFTLPIEEEPPAMSTMEEEGEAQG